MRLSAIGSVTSLVLLGSGLGATAAPLVYTYTGTVSSGYDTTGVFGAAGATLTGEKFKVAETFDPAAAFYSYTDGSSYSQAFGGSFYGTSSFATSQTTIGGHSAPAIGGNNSSDLYNQEALYHQDDVDDFINNAFGLYVNFTKFVTYSASTPYSYNDSTPSADLSADSYGQYFIYQQDTSGNIFQYADAKFTIDSVTITNGLSAVPLPASAPMFGAALIALGAFGYGMKRKKAAGTA